MEYVDECRRSFDVVTVGAGPAGLFAALEICRGNKDVSVCLVDKGPDLASRCHLELAQERGGDWLSGIGGAGFFIGGRLSFDANALTARPAHVSSMVATELIGHLNTLLNGWGATGEIQRMASERLAAASELAASAGLTWHLNYPARHLSPAERLASLRAIQSSLERSGALIMSDTLVDCVRRGRDEWEITARRGDQLLRLLAGLLVLAPGRGGARWLAETIGGLGAGVAARDSVGVRLEVRSEILAPLTGLSPDPRLSMELDSGLFRTYAFVTGGVVAVSTTEDPHRITVRPGGSTRSLNTSFSLLWQPTSPNPSRPAAAKAPALARLGSIVRTAIHENASRLPAPRPTGDVRLGDVRTHWPESYWQGLEIFLSRMDRLAPGLLDPETLLYSPAIERQWAYALSEYGESELPGLFLAGDGAGVSQGAVAAAISGMVAGRAIVRGEA